MTYVKIYKLKCEKKVYISKVVKNMANVTPMMQQYLKIKSQYQDCLLFLD